MSPTHAETLMRAQLFIFTQNLLGANQFIEFNDTMRLAKSRYRMQ